MNKTQAEEHAQKLYKKGASAYISRYSIAILLDMSLKKLTEVGSKKILKAFYPLVVNGTKHDILQKMYAEDRIE